MRRLPLVAFLVLAGATVAAFFIVQHLKVSTPLLSGSPQPSPPELNPLSDRTCFDRAHHQKVGPRTVISFYLLHATDRVDVYIVDQTGTRVATIARNRYMKASLYPHFDTKSFTWDGRVQDGSVAPNGRYYFTVHLIHQDRDVTISDNNGPLPVTVDTAAHCA